MYKTLFTRSWFKIFTKSLSYILDNKRVFLYEHYALAPSVVFRDPDLSLKAKALYGYLATYINRENKQQEKLQAWPSQKGKSTLFRTFY